MGDVVQFKRPKVAQMHKGNTLCRSGFHIGINFSSTLGAINISFQLFDNYFRSNKLTMLQDIPAAAGIVKIHAQTIRSMTESLSA